jgi:hypothetical protein
MSSAFSSVRGSAIFLCTVRSNWWICAANLDESAASIFSHLLAYTLKMEATDSPENLVPVFQSTSNKTVIFLVGLAESEKLRDLKAPSLKG